MKGTYSKEAPSTLKGSTWIDDKNDFLFAEIENEVFDKRKFFFQNYSFIFIT